MIKLESAAETDKGKERSDNQDHVWEKVYRLTSGEPAGVFIVCDGVGGHHGGQYASHLAVEAIKSEFDQFFLSDDQGQTLFQLQDDLSPDQEIEEVTRPSETKKLETMIIETGQKANSVVYDFAQQHPQEAGDAGTTLTMAVVVANWAVIANVGDSRTYLYRDKHIRQITKDHSLVASLVESGQLKPQEVFSHPQRNLIFRSLGQKDEIQIDTYVELLKKGDRLLLCSDGLWEMIQDEHAIEGIIRKSKTPLDACRTLIEVANEAGGQDNIGVVVVLIQ